MKIHSLKVRGAIGFKKGLGLDEIEVDFKGLNGLVALAGQNGFGKTTLLENLSPYRQFASRSGALRHHFFLRESFRDLTFEYGGDVYRTLVKIDAESDRTEGYVWKNDQPMIDGKVTNYSRYIENLLGSSNLFYNSVFCAQNAAKMSDMTTGDLKKMFVEFLRLDRLAGYEQAAKQCGNVLDGSAQQIQRSLDGHQERLAQFNGIERQIRQADIDKGGLERRLEDTAGRIATIQLDIERLTDIEAKNSVNIERRQDLKKDIKALQDEMLSRYNENLDEAGRVKDDLSEKKDRLKACQELFKDRDKIMQASDKALALQARLSRTREEDQKTGITLERLFEEEQGLTQKAQSLNNKIRAVKDNPERKRVDQEAVEIHETMESVLDELDAIPQEKAEAEQSFELVQIDSEISACQKAMALLDQRGDCPVENPKCAFIRSALEARGRLVIFENRRKAVFADIEKHVADIEKKAKALQADYNTAYLTLKAIAWEDHGLKELSGATIAELESEVGLLWAEQVNTRDSITSLQDQRRAAREIMDGIKADLEQAQRRAARFREIQEAESEAQLLEQEIKAMEKTIKEKRDQYTQYELQTRSKLRDLEKRLEDVKRLIDEDAPKKLSKARDTLTENERAKKALAQKIKAEDQHIAVLRQRLEEKATVEKEITRAKDELGRVTAESAQWRYLQNACGKSGLQALEIDGVAPLITGYANDLLTSTFGPNFSVRLITQDPETGKEILDIVVIRGDGSETSLENLSGGEKVWVLKSLRLAMTLVSKQKSGRDFQTLFCDEEDGALDSEKSQSFIGLYRSIMDVGGFSNCFYISHNPEVVGMADHQIRFSREGIRVI